MFQQRLKFDHGQELEMLRESVRRFSQEVIAPQAKNIDESGGIPNKLWLQMGEMGLLGATANVEFGGSGLGYLAHLIVVEEISRSSASVGLSYAAHANLCVNQLNRWASDQQKQTYLPELCSGAKIGALAMSEAGAGSDVTSMALSATRYDDGYRLNGSKMWITNGPQADIVVTYAKTDPDKGNEGISAFIVNTNSDGFSVAQKLDKFGMRGSETGELVFDDCFVPIGNRLGEEGQGIEILMSGLDYERLVLTGGPLGIMAACLDLVVPYVQERKQFGAPVGSFQLMQGKLADMYTAFNASRAYAYATAQAADNGHLTRRDAASCLLFAAEHATRCALETIQALGGNGYVTDSPAGRLLRDAKLYEIGAGTSEIRRWLIGRDIVADC